MRRRLLVLATVAAGLATTACRQGAQDRALADAARARSQTPVRASDVVQSLRASDDSGRLVYDAPIDLSDSTLRRTRPDLVRLDSARIRAHSNPGRSRTDRDTSRSRPEH